MVKDIDSNEVFSMGMKRKKIQPLINLILSKRQKQWHRENKLHTENGKCIIWLAESHPTVGSKTKQLLVM